MIQKHILVPQRLRHPPASGWSWIDRRFLREHGDSLSREATLLYLFLAAVADRHGLSCYSDTTLTARLRLSLPVLQKARQELLERDLIAQQLPIVQVLTLPQQRVERRSEPGQGLIQLGDLFRQIADTPRPVASPAASPPASPAASPASPPASPAPPAGSTPNSRRNTP